MDLKKIGQDLLAVIFPKPCPICDVLLPHKQLVCESCWPQIHFTHWGMNLENPMAKRCQVLFQLDKAYALMYYSKENGSGNLIKNLKYHHQQDIGQWLADRCLTEISIKKEDFDAICPVPLHPKKEQERGYHQLAVFCERLSQKTGIPLVWALKRTEYQKAQAQKNQQERHYKNNVFAINQNIAPSRLLLIDDVFTTGSTITNCAWSLIKAGHRVSVLCFAFDDDDGA